MYFFDFRYDLLSKNTQYMAFMITLHNAGSPLNDNVKEQRKKEKNIIL